MIKKYLKLTVASAFFILALFLLPKFSLAAGYPINLYFFYGDGCPHCAKEEIFLEKLQAEDENIRVHAFEVWYNRDNAKILADIGRRFNINVSSVPILIVGDQVIPGFLNEETTGVKIREIIKNYEIGGCVDKVAPILGQETGQESCIHGCEADDEECRHNCDCEADSGTKSELSQEVSLPFLGEVNLKKMSLPLLTLVIAGLDGFNPCAMWTLLFLISLLLGMEDRRRMWILGSAFIITSGAVYFIFMSAWLNLIIFFGFIFWVRALIALLSLFGGGYNVGKYFKDKKSGCDIAGGEKRQVTFEKLKDITKSKSFWLSLLGIMLLAVSVNLVELFCSAGLPAVYTQVLSLANLAPWQYYLYLLFYIFIFMLDDIVVFAVAMITLRAVGITTKYSRLTRLAGGIIMIIIGILLLFKPGWLMF